MSCINNAKQSFGKITLVIDESMIFKISELKVSFAMQGWINLNFI